MVIAWLRQFMVPLVAFLAGIITSFISFVTPLTEEAPQLLKKPTPTPILTEETRILTKEEQATMSGSFIKEFEGLIASNSGER